MNLPRLPIAKITKAEEGHSGFISDALPRGLALFFGGFALLNLLGNLRVARFDANLWWIDLRWLSSPFSNLFLALAGLSLGVFGLRPPRALWARRLVVVCAALLGIVSLVNGLHFFVLLARRTVSSSVPLPLSLLVAASMWLICRSLRTTDFRPFQWRALWPPLAVTLVCMFAFPIGEMLCFGKTDYRRPADIVVVPGCRVYADGRPSDALRDRVRTACQLYRDGWTRKILFSGGPGDGAISEVQAMRTLAIRLGVKPEDILLDDKGLNTQATVRNSKPILKNLNASRVMVVSHFYHLPRIKLAYQRAGWEVYTVPAKESYLLRQMPYNMAREVAALWVYYMRPLAG